MESEAALTGLCAVATLLIEARERLESLTLSRELGSDELWSDISRAHGLCSELQRRAAMQEQMMAKSSGSG